METKKTNIRLVLAFIIIPCAITIMIMHYFNKASLEDFIMPIILLCFSIILLVNKPKEEAKPLKLSSKKRNLMLIIIGITIVAGLIASILI